jgi:type II secretory pathway pseudopilin PulG
MKQNKQNPNGFALIATILLMVLLAIITVGTLSLSVVTLRTGNQDSAQARARANARMALMIAIGELQKQMGPDQRISANSAILDSSSVPHSHWLGVWDSWKAGVGEASQHSTIEGIADQMAPTYLPNRSDYFRKWLVSLNEDEMSNIDTPKNLSLSASPLPSSDDDAIFLVADGSLGTDAGKAPDYVAARILDVKDKGTSEVTGRYGWWIGDESQKARLMDDSYLSAPTTPALTAAEKIYRSAAPGSMGTKTISGLENMTDDGQLAALPSLATLDLVTGAAGRPAQQNFHDATPFSYSILTDVREGGLKRDLSTILEQPILRTDNGPEYMLYEFDDARFTNLGNPLDDRRANSRVPIQDLAAYYQMYDDEASFSNQRREGVRYTSTARANTIQTRVADLDGGTRDKQRFLREYTAQYKQPVITKIQFLLAMTSEPITDADRLAIVARFPTNPSLHIRATDTHKLRLGLMPMITLWNPNNLPMVMDSSQLFTMYPPPFAMQFRKYRDGGATGTDLRWFNLSGSTYNGPSGGNSGGYAQFILRLARQTIPRQTYVFEPGEVKVFSLPSTSGGKLNDASTALVTLGQENVNNTINSWDPFGIFRIYSSSPSAPNQAPEVYHFTTAGAPRGEMLVFGPNDRISLRIDTDSPTEAARATSGIGADGRAVSKWIALTGAGFHHYMMDEQYANPWTNLEDAWRHNVMLSRHGGGSANLPLAAAAATFNRDLLLPSFPGGTAPIEFDSSSNAIPGTQIIAAGADNDVISLMEFSLNIGCETGNAASGGFGGGRRITSRPFLHSPLSVPPFIDQNDKASLYNYGWDWSIGKVNAVEDSIVTAKPGTGNGYFGGGYSLENGTTHVIQREIPVLPPISIASLSHAELGGFSLAYSKCMGDNPDTDTFWSKTGPAAANRIWKPIGVDYQRVTATGQGGLAPHVQQAIGNSYAHPNIPSNRAFTTVTRLFDLEEGSKVVPFVDHSYLANKALWDEFFFSSIAPQPSKVQLYGASATRTAKDVAEDFFRFNDSTSPIPLPNRRVVPYKSNLDQATLDTLFTEANLFRNGLADKIAAHLLVEGALNINSTSVESWKVFLSSLKGKPVAYLNGGIAPQEAASEGTAINFSNLPNVAPVKTADITKSNSPEEQWKTGRYLTDEEIEELAVAIVKQVKLRGPFLSTSEFINRRLEGNATADASARSSKGALQAALDDEDVSINANFRTSARLIDAETSGITGFQFPDAAKGPIGYGSAPYVDQADVLRHFSEQLTPRGDTFVIRTYGDALDSNGKVIARAWCQAVVQRFPDYVDATDSAHEAQSAITDTNRIFGRKLQIVNFHWLNPNEI